MCLSFSAFLSWYNESWNGINKHVPSRILREYVDFMKVTDSLYFFASFDIFEGYPHSVAYICLTSAVHLIYFAISSVLWKIFNFRQTIRSEAPRCHANGYGCVYEAFGEIVFWISCKILCWNFHFNISCLINRTRPPMVDYWAAAIRCREQNRQACLFVIMRSFKHGVFRTDAC